MKKKSFAILLSILACCYSCSNEWTEKNYSQEEKKESAQMSAESLNLLKQFVSSTTTEIYHNAYDQKFENIDYEGAMKILSIYDFSNHSIDITSFLSKPESRAATDFDVTLKNNLTERQYVLMQEILSLESPTIEEFDNIKEKALLLDEGERALVVYTIDAIKTIIDGMMTSPAIFTETRAWSAKSRTFLCNVVSGTVGTVFGFVAGALSGPAAPVVATIVSIGVSSYISTEAC